MEKSLIELNLILDLFPYAFVLDKSLSIQNIGESLVKITGDIENQKFEDYFDIERPYIDKINYDVLLANKSEAFYLKHRISGLFFRGQFKYIETLDYFVYLASLWVTSIDQLKPFQITISDFKCFDPTFDYLHVLKQSEIHKTELTELVNRIDNKSADLKSAKTQLESILIEISDVVWSISLPNYQLLFVTPSVKNLYEISPEALMEDTTWWQKIIHPEDEGIIEEIYAQLIRQGFFDVMHRIITPSGVIKWVNNRGKYIHDNNNLPIRLDGILIDKTSQYKAKDTLDQEIKLQEVLIDIASTYINLDPKDVENTINTSLEKMGLFVQADRSYIFDYDFENETTSNKYEWCNLDIEPEIENLQVIPLAFFPQWVEQHKNGKAFYVPNVLELTDEKDSGLKLILEPQGIKSLIAIPMLDGNQLLGFVGFDSVKKHHDYSEKEQRLLFLFGQMLINIRSKQKWENQLRIQEEKYRNIIANMNLGLLEVDLNDIIVYANQSFCEMSGFTLVELKGLNAGKLFLNENQIEIIEEKSKSRLQAISDSYEVEVKVKNGEERWWFISGAPNYNDEGKLIGSIGIHLDITKQKTLEKELAKAKTFAESAAKAKELFLANMSHEIRTPLNVIIGMIRQLTKENLTHQQHFYIKQSESSAKHLLTILNNILDIAKIESGDMEIEQEAFSPKALVDNAYSIMHSQSKEKNIDFKLNVSNAIKHVLLGDETRLRQVLINLIGNAIKFTDYGYVSLAVMLVEENSEGQLLKFEVKDTGIGMSPDFIHKIFNKFTQEQNTSNRKYEGTGLGLAITNDLIKLMGGTLKVESTKNHGTTFSFELHFPISSKENLMTNSTTIKSGIFNEKKVLLVEDNEMNRFIAIQSLDYLGFETVEAENGKIAIEYVQKETFDLILMDIQMPVMDGVAATSFIRNVLNIKTPIIALTANAFKHDIELYIKKGITDYIIKPYDEEDFYRKIELVLNSSYSIKNEKLEKENIIENIKLYDLTQIEKISRGNDDFIQKMITLFNDLITTNLLLLNDAMDQKDFNAIKRITHKIKPSVEQMGISSIKETIRYVENYDLSAGNWQELGIKVNEINSCLTKVVESIKGKRF